jgi:hypothetical protein
MPCRLEERVLISQLLTSQMYSLTVYKHPHFLDETVDDLKCLRCRHPSLILGKAVQPLKNHIDAILSEKLVHKFLCIASLSQEIHQRRRTHLLVLS